MNILEKIVLKKREWVAQQKAKMPLETVMQRSDYRRTTFSLLDKVRSSNDAAIIAEFKRKSPSKGNIFDSEFLKQYKGKFKGVPFRTYVGLKYKGGYSDHFPVFIHLIRTL